MNVKKFKIKARDAGVRFSNKSYGGLEWSEWYTLAEMTNKVNYGCNFKDGKCEKLREDLKKNPNASEMCCCDKCGYHVGYLKYIKNDPDVLKMMSDLFDAKLGFLETRCRGVLLPRKYRSALLSWI